MQNVYNLNSISPKIMTKFSIKYYLNKLGFNIDNKYIKGNFHQANILSCSTLSTDNISFLVFTSIGIFIFPLSSSSENANDLVNALVPAKDIQNIDVDDNIKNIIIYTNMNSYKITRNVGYLTRSEKQTIYNTLLLYPKITTCPLILGNHLNLYSDPYFLSSNPYPAYHKSYPGSNDDVGYNHLHNFENNINFQNINNSTMLTNISINSKNLIINNKPALLVVNNGEILLDKLYIDNQHNYFLTNTFIIFPAHQIDYAVTSITKPKKIYKIIMYIMVIVMIVSLYLDRNGTNGLYLILFLICFIFGTFAFITYDNSNSNCLAIHTENNMVALITIDNLTKFLGHNDNVTELHSFAESNGFAGGTKRECLRYYKQEFKKIKENR